MLRSRLFPLLLVALALGGFGLVLWTLRARDPVYAGLHLGSSLPRVQAELERHGGELRCRTLPLTHLTDCSWAGSLPALPGTPVEIRIAADQRHRVLGEIRIEHALPHGTSAEEWMRRLLREWGMAGAMPEREQSTLTFTLQRPRAQAGYRGARASVEESTGRVSVVLFDTTIAMHAAEPGSL